jgi:hypothetical protein
MTDREPIEITNLDRYGYAELSWQLYRLILNTAFGVATAEPYGATRWRFNR